MIAQHLFILQAAQEFQLTKLLRLKSAGRFQLAAECQEVRGEHGLKNRKLLHQHSRNFRAASQQPRRFIHFVS